MDILCLASHRRKRADLIPVANILQKNSLKGTIWRIIVI